MARFFNSSFLLGIVTIAIVGVLLEKQHKRRVALVGQTLSAAEPTNYPQGLVEGESAEAWRLAIAGLPEDNSTWQAVLARLAQKDMALAFKKAVELAHDRPELEQIAYEAVLDTLAQDGNYAAARQVLEQIPNGEIKNHLITNLTLQWGHDDPLGAADWLIGFSTDVDRVSAFAQLGRAWAEVQPQEAAEILFQLPAGELRRSALTAALLAWIDKNPAAASAWLAQLEPHPDLDLVAARIARVPSLVRMHIDMALGWAETINDANERIQALGSIVIQWADTDRSEAVRYVQNSPGLTSAQRATLLEDIGTEHGVL
jgi:hypothetical protein